MEREPIIIYFLGESESSKKLPSNLRKRLSGRISMDDIHEITYLIQNNNKGRQRLYNLIFDEDERIVTNTLWIMNHFSLSENTWLYQKQDEMIDKLLLTTNKSQQRLLLNLLYRQPLANPPRIDFLDYCLEETIARKEAVGTTTICMKLAYEICRMIPELLQEFRAALDIMEDSQLPPSLKTTRKNILKAMKKGKSLQSY